MEMSMAYLFKRCEMDFDQQKPKRTDFVFPNLKTYKDRPEVCLVSAKHTLAERSKGPDSRSKGNWKKCVVGDLLICSNTDPIFKDIESFDIITYIIDSEYQKFKGLKEDRPINEYGQGHPIRGPHKRPGKDCLALLQNYHMLIANRWTISAFPALALGLVE